MRRRRMCLGVGLAALVVGLLPSGCVGAGLIGPPDGGEASDAGPQKDAPRASDVTPPKDVTTPRDVFVADVTQVRDVVSHDVGEDVSPLLDSGRDAAHDAELDVASAHDAGHDAGHDSGFDAGHDAGQDSGGLCGTSLCTPKQTCSGTQCVACTPTVTTIAQNDAPPLPGGGTDGLKVTCGDASNGYSAACPVVVCGQVSYWFFSDGNNDEDLFMVGYYPPNTVYNGPVTIPDNRYVDSVTVNTTLDEVTITGQNGPTVEPFSFFQ